MQRRWFLIAVGVLVAAYIAWYTRHPFGAGNYVERGIPKAKAGDLDGAIEDFTAAIRIEPWKPAAWYCRGKAYFERQDWTAAVADLTEALDQGCTLKAEALRITSYARQQPGDTGSSNDAAGAPRLRPEL